MCVCVCVCVCVCLQYGPYTQTRCAPVLCCLLSRAPSGHLQPGPSSEDKEPTGYRVLPRAAGCFFFQTKVLEFPEEIVSSPLPGPAWPFPFAILLSELSCTAGVCALLGPRVASGEAVCGAYEQSLIWKMKV